MKAKPRAILDITSLPPLKWTEVSCQNILDAAFYGMPIETISVPLLGAVGRLPPLRAVCGSTQMKVFPN